MKQKRRWSVQLFLMLHDPFTGAAEVSPELLEFGNAAAQLAELIIARSLRVGNDDHVVPVVHVRPGLSESTDAGEFVLGCIAEQRSTHSVRTWVTDLGTYVTNLVVREVVDAGVVRHETRRGLFGRRKSDMFPAQDLLQASSSRNEVRHMLVHPDEFDLPGATLASIVGALGAQRIFEVPDTRDIVAELNGQLPWELQSVMQGLSAAVAAESVTMGRRR